VREVSCVYAGESGFYNRETEMVDYEIKLKEAMSLSHTERLDRIFDLLANIASLSQQIWPNADLKQEALDEITMLAKEAQTLC
jgi:hypothetical protein